VLSLQLFWQLFLKLFLRVSVAVFKAVAEAVFIPCGGCCLLPGCFCHSPGAPGASAS
jgi:hypothetical protein